MTGSQARSTLLPTGTFKKGRAMAYPKTTYTAVANTPDSMEIRGKAHDSIDDCYSDFDRWKELTGLRNKSIEVQVGDIMNYSISITDNEYRLSYHRPDHTLTLHEIKAMHPDEADCIMTLDEFRERVKCSTIMPSDGHGHFIDMWGQDVPGDVFSDDFSWSEVTCLVSFVAWFNK